MNFFPLTFMKHLQHLQTFEVFGFKFIYLFS